MGTPLCQGPDGCPACSLAQVTLWWSGSLTDLCREAAQKKQHCDHFTHNRLVKMSESDNTKCAELWSKGNSQSLWVGVEIGTNVFGEQFGKFL